MFLSSGYAQIVGFLPAMTRIPKAELLAEGVTGDIISVALEIAKDLLRQPRIEFCLIAATFASFASFAVF